MRSHHEILDEAQRLTHQIQVTLTSRRKKARERRIQRTYQAEVRVSFGREQVAFRASEISPTGLFLHSRLLLEPGEELEVSFPTPQGRDELVARGVVASVETESPSGGSGMRIAFYDLAGDIEQLGVYAEAA